MARIEVATEAWGYVVDRRGRPKAGATATITATVYAAATGGSTVSSFTSDDEGFLPGWVEPGRYTFTEPDGDVRTVVAGGGYQTMMDESSTMAKRDTLKFEGSAVELQDDSANDRTRVIITGSPGATGPPGEIFGVDVWNEQATPGSVSDWGPTINTLISAGEKLLLFRNEDFPFSTTIDLAQTYGVTFKGMAGAYWTPAPSGHTRLRFTGTGSGNAIDMAGIDANRTSDPTFEDIAFQYTSASYTGTYFGSNFVTNAMFKRCGFSYGAHEDDITAAGVFDMNGGINWMFDKCVFQGFLNYLTGWVPSVEPEYCNTARFQNVVFQGQTEISVINPGDSWVFDNTLFESVSQAGTVLDTHVSIEDTGDWGVAVTFRDCTHWDATDAALDPTPEVRWVRQNSGISARLLFENCVEHNPNQTASLELHGNGHVTLIGGDHGTVDFGDGTVAGEKKQSIALINPTFANPPVDLNSGHQNVGGLAVYDFDNENQGGWADFRNHTFIEVADNRASINRSTAAVASGAPSGTAVHEKRGNDRTGYIVVRNDSGGNLAAGTGIEVTQANPYVVPDNGGNVRPRVTLTPANANAAAMGAYAPDPTVVDKWRIAWANATLPAGQTAAFNYLVTYGTEQT